jgi:nucleoside-diphosphate-sugar epimerase
MKILITGVNGFIGQHLAKKLLKRKRFVLGIGQTKSSKVSDIKLYYKGSVLDKKLLEKALEETDIIVHLAAITSHKEIVDKKSKALETNLLGTKNVIEAFLKSKRTKKFIFASTGKVYGKILYLPITEEHPTNPLNILGKSKLEVENLIKRYDNNSKDLTIFRIFNVYGPGQNENFLIPTILKQLSLGKKELALGDVEAKRDYVYVDDLVEAFILAIEKEKKGISIYNICTGIGTSAAQIVNMIDKIKGEKIGINVNPDLIRIDEMKNEYGSFKLAKKNLGWEPKISLEDGLKLLLKN